MSKDFGDILKKYYGDDDSLKKRKNKSKKKKNTTVMKIDMKALIDKYPVINKDAEYENKDFFKGDKPYTQKQLDKMYPQDQIDLHEMTVIDAKIALDIFFTKCQSKKLKKVAIIHGKGKHSKNGPVLKHFVQKYLDWQDFTGKTSHPKESEGGKGTTWVILK